MPTATPLLRRGLPYVPPYLLVVAGVVSIYNAHGGTVQPCPPRVADPRADPGGHHSVPVDETHHLQPCTPEVHAVRGCVFAHHVQRGGPAGPLGPPVSEEIAIPGGTVTYFAGAACGAPGPDGAGSAIYAGPTGTHDVRGCIYARYRELGGPGSALGFPTSDEVPISGGRVSHFQYGYIVTDGARVNVVYD